MVEALERATDKLALVPAILVLLALWEVLPCLDGILRSCFSMLFQVVYANPAGPQDASSKSEAQLVQAQTTQYTIEMSMCTCEPAWLRLCGWE